MNLPPLFKQTLKLTTLSLALILSPNTNAHKHASTSEISFETTKISSDLYMLSGVGGFAGGNIALTVGDDGVVMVDNGVSSLLDVLKEEIKKTTEKPIDYLINTHLHKDHTGNNAGFSSEGAQIISHDNVRSALSKDKSADALPVMTFSDQMTLHINGDTAKIIHVKNAHTNGDAVIHFQKANVVHTGDLMFNGLFPFIDASNGGKLDGVLVGLKMISSLSNEETKIIPGHGPLAGKADVEKTIALLEDARSLIGALITQGKTDEEIHTANPLSKYESYSWSFINTKKMTDQVIANFR